MKTFKNFKILNERKQYTDLYHFSSLLNIDSSTKTNDIIGDISFLVKKNDWCVTPFVANSSANKHLGFTKMKKIRFFIGDKEGNISNFSSEITSYTKNNIKNINKISDI